MAFEINKFVRELDYKLSIFSLQEAAALCEEFVKYLFESNAQVTQTKAEKILMSLRSSRMFAVMLKVADALIMTRRESYTIRRQYAQSLIELGTYAAAIYTLQDLIADTGKTLSSDELSLSENTKARALIGRVYKQLYVNANNPSNPQCLEFLSTAAETYYAVYLEDNNKIYQGINTVALLERAKRDKVEIPVDADSHQLAEAILKNVEMRYENDDKKINAWDFAVAAEACVALDNPEEALRWISGYARMPYAGAFELSGTLRQLEDVWQLDLNSEMGQHLIPLLRSELTKRSGSTLTMSIAEVKLQNAVASTVEKKYDLLIEGTQNINEETKLEKVFGTDSFKSYQWFRQGLDRCLAIARIGKDPTKGLGSGFLLKGKDLQESLGEELVLLTNYHVVSESGASALRPKQAIVIFEALNAKEIFRNLTIHWSSPINNLDATVLRFNEKDHERLHQLTKDLQFYPISDDLPPVEKPPKEKVYVIGHPGGNTLQISFQDNLLIDHDKISKLHYRTPTEPGSSGSPVFNDQWDLIGLHHSGSDKMARLNGGEETYQANEGIWIQAIRNKMAEKNNPA